MHPSTTMIKKKNEVKKKSEGKIKMHSGEGK
jgi:hypothetical protein